jgi:S-adenosylmethionine decarboxylase
MKAQMHNFNCWINEIDSVLIKKKYENLLSKSGFGIISIQEKHFEPQGYTVLFLLSESHFAIHTFPEEGQSYIELSSCVFKPFLKFVSNIKSDENQTNNGVSA